MPSRLCWVDGGSLTGERLQHLSPQPRAGSGGRWEGMVPKGPGLGAPLAGSERPLVLRRFPAGVRGTGDKANSREGARPAIPQAQASL